MKKVFNLISIFLIITFSIVLASCFNNAENPTTTTIDIPTTTTTTNGNEGYKFESIEFSKDFASAKLTFVSESDAKDKKTFDVSATFEITKDATCAEEGIITLKASYDGKEYTEEIKTNKLEHQYSSQVILPTYDVEGYTLHTCSVCGDTYKDNNVPALVHEYSEEWSYDEDNHYHMCIDSGYEDLKGSNDAHTFDEGVVTKEATPLEEGIKEKTCTVCGYKKNEEIPVRAPYNISLDLDGGTSETITETSISITHLDKSFFPFDITKGSYNFMGWWVEDTQVFDKDGNIVNQVELKDGLVFKAVLKEEVILTINYSLYNPKTNELIDDKPENIAELTGAGNYDWDSEVELSTTPYQGYIFTGWYKDGTLLSSEANYTLKLGNIDVMLEARYKYEIYNLNLTSANPSLGLVLIKNTDATEAQATHSASFYYNEDVTIAYTTLTDVEALGFYNSDGGLISSEAEISFKMPNSDYNIKAYWNYFSISYELNDGENNEANPTSYKIEDGEIILKAPTQTGYTFKGWYSGKNLIYKIEAENKVDYLIEAKFEPNTDTIYKVEHYLENIDSAGYTLFEVEELRGTTNTFSTAKAKAYDYYEKPSVIQQVVKCDGSAIVRIYYNRAKYELELSKNFDEAGELTGSGAYYYNDSVTISTTTNVGYKFDGWYDGDILISNDETYTFKMPAQKIEYTAQWNPNTNVPYKVEHYQKNIDDDEYTLYETEDLIGTAGKFTAGHRKLYEGFISPQYVEQVIISGDGSTVLKIYYPRKEYNLSLDMNLNTAGTISESATYRYEKEITIVATTNEGYEFNGWFDGDTLITTEATYTFKMPANDLSYTAKWTAGVYKITLDNQAAGVTVSGVTSGNGYDAGTEIKLVAANIPTGYTLTWSIGEDIVCVGSKYSFNSPSKDITIIVKTADMSQYIRNGNKIYFGTYPQSRVAATEDNGLSSITFDSSTWTSYKYYSHGEIADYMYYIDVDINEDNVFDYRGVYFTQYRPWSYDDWSSEYNTRQKENGYNPNNIYWFSYELIEWDILEENEGKALIIANLILDSQDIYPDESINQFEHNNGTGYANNYELSQIRKWLNDTFYNTAFTTLQKTLIKATTVDNSAESTMDSANTYACNNTTDNIFLLSYKEATTYYETKEARQAKATDYAKSQGLSVNYGENYYGKGFWWLRSPYYKKDTPRTANAVSCVYDHGIIYDRSASMSYCGVRPALVIIFEAVLKEEVILTINYSLYNPKTNELIDDKPENIAELTGAGNYALDSEVELSTTPYQGYIFTGWYKDGTLLSSEANYTLKLGNIDVMLEARYKYETYNLNLTSANPSLGLVLIKNTDATEAQATHSASFYYNEDVTIAYTTLTDVEALGFYNSDGGLISSEAEISFKMPNSDYNIKAYWNYFSISYDLDGGENNEANPTSYKIEDEEFELQAPTKGGYTFKGWYSGNDVITKINPQYMLNYTLTANFIANTDTPYKVEHYQKNIDDDEYTLYETEDLIGTTGEFTAGHRKLYEGFISPQYVEQTIISGDGSTVLKIYYPRKEYNLTLDMNIATAGTITDSDTYRYDKEITIVATSNEGYGFNGWFDGDTLITTEASYTFKMPANDLSYTAKWTAGVYKITLDNQAAGVTVSGVTSGNGYDAGTEIKLVAANIPTGYTLTWSIGEDIVCVGSKYSFNSPSKDITIIVKTADMSQYIRNGDKIYFGTYPQSRVAATEDNGLSAITFDSSTWTSYKYYSNGEIADYMYYIDVDINDDNVFDYRGVYFTQYRPWSYDKGSSEYNTRQKENGYNPNNIYWFSYDLIEWDILEETDGKALIIANLILDSQDIYPDESINQFEHNNGTGYANNYELSQIRKWLNEAFYNTAFTTLQKTLIEATTIDNSAESTMDSANTYACNNTTDNIFLLSYKEATTYYETKEARQAKVTDYAKSQGLSVNYGENYYGKGFWWLRSPYYVKDTPRTAHVVSCVYDHGNIYDRDASMSYCGVRPALVIIL